MSDEGDNVPDPKLIMVDLLSLDFSCRIRSLSMMYPYFSDLNFYHFRIMRMWMKRKAACEGTQQVFNHVSARVREG